MPTLRLGSDATLSSFGLYNLQLFAHMLAMPKPQFKPVFYCIILQARRTTAGRTRETPPPPSLPLPSRGALRPLQPPP